MEKFLLIDDCDGVVAIIDCVLSFSKKSAQKVFDNRGWITGEVLAEGDYLNEMYQSQMECSLEIGE